MSAVVIVAPSWGERVVDLVAEDIT